MYSPLSEEWGNMIDIVLRMMNNEDIEGEWMVWEKHVWWGHGVEWAKDLHMNEGGYTEVSELCAQQDYRRGWAG